MIYLIQLAPRGVFVCRGNMATCQICKKSGQSGNNVSHSKRRTRTRWSANVQRAQIFIDGQQQSVKICTRCLRTHNKQMIKN